jgi:hypothetical protein
MNTSRKWLALLGCAALPALLICGASFADESTAAAGQTSGVWQKHEYSFAYMGFTSTYSCDGLADKLKLLLIASGARQDAKAQPGACASGFGRPDKFARASLTFYTLAPGNETGSEGSADTRVAGLWSPVALTDRSPRELRVGDCELVEQFRNMVLPMFTTRNLEDHTTCVPHQQSGSMINLKFESFRAVPKHPGKSAKS